MKRTPTRFFSALGPALAVALLLGGPAARAGITAALLSTQVGNYSGYVIDADAADAAPGTDRDVIQAGSSVRFTKIGGPFSETRRFQTTFSLLDESGALVLLDLGGGLTGTTVTTVRSITLSFLTTTTGENLTSSLKPAAMLDPQARYRVRGALAAETAPNSGVYDTVGSQSEPNARSYIHFTHDPAVSDAPWNVVAQLDPVGFQRRVIIRNVAGQEKFYLAISGTLHRYDDTDVAASTANVPVTVRWMLNDLVAGELGLVETETLLNVSIDSYVAGSPNAPATARFTVLAPLELPDWSVLNPSHLMKGTALAEWSDFDDTVNPIGTTVTPPALLLALSGRLFFAGLDGVETAFSEVTGDPTVGLTQTGGDPHAQFTTSLQIPVGKGTLPGAPGFTFGRATPIPVIVFGSNGDALFDGGLGSVEVTPPVLEVPEMINGVRIKRLGMTLSQYGLRATNLHVYFPSGLSFRCKTEADGPAYSAQLTRNQGGTDLVNVDLGPDAMPTLAVFPLAPPNLTEMWVTHESLPVRFQTPNLYWVVGDGSFRFTPFDTAYVRRGRLNGRLSNDGYFDSVSARVGEEIVVRPKAGGGSTFDGAVDFQPGTVASHFPKGMAAAFNSGTLKLIAGAISMAESGLITDGTPVDLSYSRACQEDACGPAAARPGTLSLTPTTEILGQLGQLGWAFTPDGGLRTGGPVAPAPLQFGGTSPTVFAHETSPFSEGTALIAGHRLSASALTPGVPDASRAAALLLCGHGSPNDAELVERPGTAAYFEGMADYAGFNFRTGADGAASVVSRLGGTVIGPYPLRDFSKYYARPGGVSGLQQAVLGSLPGSFPFYGFITQIDNLRLSFLDSTPHESRTDGAIQIPDPPTANPAGAGLFFPLAFQRLLFSCSGQLRDARLADYTEKTLLYWGLRFSPISLRFATPEGCVAGNTNGAVVLGVSGNMDPLIPQPLTGELGFRPNGDLLTAQSAAALNPPIKGVDSRLTLPSRINIKGAGGKDFALTPCTKVYLSSYDPANPDGFVNFAGTLKVPFFDAVKVHIHARGTNGALVYIMGGWPSDPNAGPGQGWNVGGKHFFNDAKFDSGNSGRPAGVPLDAYRDGPTNQYHPVTHKKWMSGLAFDYPLRWNVATRSFTSHGPDPETEIFLFKLQNRLKYLSAAGAEVTFGAQFDGLPNINMQQLFNDQLDRALGGAFSSLESAANEALHDAAKATHLVAAVEALDRLVSDQILTLLDAPLDVALIPAADAIYKAITNEYKPGFLDALKQEAAISNAMDSATMAEIDKALDTALNSGGQIHSQIDANLVKAIAGVDAALDFIKPNRDTGKREALIKLAEKLVKGAGIAGAAAGAAIQSLVDKYLPQADALFAEIQFGLEPLRLSLVQIRTSLSQAGGLLERFRAALDPKLKEECHKALLAHYGKLRDETGRYFQEISPDTVKKTMRGVIKKQFFASGTPVQWQGLLRLGVGEAKGIFRAQLDGMFGQLSQELRNALTPHLPGLDNTPIQAVTEIANALKGAKFDGYAKINGDTLSTLRVNAELQLRLGAGNDAASDSGGGMKFSGFYEATELESDSPPIGCLRPGQARAQVTVGAEVGKPGGTLGGVSNLKLQGQALFNDSGKVLGLQGHVELGAGMNVKSTSLPGMTLDLALGSQGYYLLGRARGKFKVVEADCALFIGTTCHLTNLAFLDPDTTRLLDEIGLKNADRFTGFYLNAVGAISLNTLLGVPDTCIFSAKLKAGFGEFAVFYNDGAALQDKVALGYRQLGGLSGTLLCGLDVEAELAIIGAAVAPLPINDTSLLDSLNGLSLNAQGRVTAKLTAWGEEILSKEVIVKAHLSAGGGISFSADY